VVDSLPFPAGWLLARDIAWDTSSLWISENFNSRIYELDPANGNVLSSFPSPSPDMRGLTFDGQFLWDVDHAGVSLMRFDFSADGFESGDTSAWSNTVP
jgi:hypothetical protein